VVAGADHWSGTGCHRGVGQPGRIQPTPRRARSWCTHRRDRSNAHGERTTVGGGAYSRTSLASGGANSATLNGLDHRCYDVFVFDFCVIVFDFCDFDFDFDVGDVYERVADQRRKPQSSICGLPSPTR
jgi:hypothetical protein